MKVGTQNFILSYVVSLEPAWATWVSVRVLSRCQVSFTAVVGISLALCTSHIAKLLVEGHPGKQVGPIVTLRQGQGAGACP